MKRRYRALRDGEPRPAYDAVVVGSGVGGLVAANLLAREGLAVLLVEQHYMAGGLCSTFLYLVGHWTRPGGGITPVIVSALHAAEAILGRDCAAPVFTPREVSAS